MHTKISGTAMTTFLLILYANVSWYSLSLVFPLSLMLAGLALLREREPISMQPAGVAWSLAAAVVLLDNSYSMPDSTLRFVAGVILVLMLGLSASWKSAFVGALKAVSVVHVVASFAFLYVPGLYPRVVALLFSPELQSRLIGWYESGYATGLAVHYSQNGVFLSLAFGVALCLLWNANPGSRGIQIIFVALAFVALLLSGKRGALLFSIAASAGVYYFSTPRNRFTRGLLILGALAVVFGLLSGLGAELSPYFGTVSRIVNSIGTADLSGGRAELYWYAWEWFRSSPLLGIGWLEYPLRINYTAIGTIYGFGSNMYVHNIYLQLLCETGILGTGIFITAFGISLRQTVRLLATTVEHHMLLQISLFIQMFFLLYGLTGNALYDKASLIPYLLACATVMRLTAEERRACELES